MTTLASVNTAAVSSPFLSGRLNLAALPDSERALLPDAKESPFESALIGGSQFYECHMHRIKVGTAGAFARKRPPSRYASANLAFQSHSCFDICFSDLPTAPNLPRHSTRHLSPPRPLSKLNQISIQVFDIRLHFYFELQPDTSIISIFNAKVDVRAAFVEASSVKPHLISNPRSPFRVPLGDLREALAGLKPIGECKQNGNSPSANASNQTLTVSKNSAFCPPLPHSQVDFPHDSSPSNYHRAMPHPSHPSTTEKNVRSPDWTEALPSDTQNRNFHAPPHLHHYPRYSPASNRGSPHTSPAKASGALDNSARITLPPTSELLAPLFNSKQPNLMRGPLHGFGTDDPLPY
ncbi:unnamed protein product [Rodentolepis nana]|uniref:Velvet domain-containing protein n=1 Tax=Rodentolepis nana TaxID=102285 RepID=A0A158QJH9_RODNA|nr:unnamed protein product [Rodentolepis nana]